MKTKLCGWVGCKELISSGYYCAKHKQLSDQRKKESAFKNATRYADYNNPEWRKLSKEYLNEKGCCERCGSSESLQVHHIIPVRYAPELFLDRSNLMVLCRSCHQIETANEIRERNKR